MRAGLIIGGAFMMLFGAILFFSIILLPLGLLFGLIGFIMLIVGLFTSTHKYPPTHTTQQVTISVPQQHAAPAITQAPEVLVICPECDARVSAKVKFCPECGTTLLKQKAAFSDKQIKTMVLGYLRDRAGEIDVGECADELELSVK